MNLHTSYAKRKSTFFSKPLTDSCLLCQPCSVGCVNGYLKCVEYKRVSSTVFTCQPADEPLCMSYLSVVESSRQEDTLVCYIMENKFYPFEQKKSRKFLCLTSCYMFS